MRTKTLALSAVLGMLGTASLVAQNVYSINAVGYVNVTLYPGFNLVTCPLICSPDNTIATIFNNTNNPNGLYQNGNLHEAAIYTYSGGSLAQVDNASSHTNLYPNGWQQGGTTTVNPGQAVFFWNPGTIGTGTNMYATFVGTVPQSTTPTSSQLPNGLTNYISPGYNLTGSIVPASGDLITNSITSLTNALSLGPKKNDAILVFDPTYNSNTLAQGSYTTTPYTPAGGWTQAGQDPDPTTVNVTEGFWYLSNQAAGVTNVWTENFTINP